MNMNQRTNEKWATQETYPRLPIFGCRKHQHCRTDLEMVHWSRLGAQYLAGGSYAAHLSNHLFSEQKFVVPLDWMDFRTEKMHAIDFSLPKEGRHNKCLLFVQPFGSVWIHPLSFGPRKGQHWMLEYQSFLSWKSKNMLHPQRTKRAVCQRHRKWNHHLESLMSVCGTRAPKQTIWIDSACSCAIHT